VSKVVTGAAAVAGTDAGWLDLDSRVSGLLAVPTPSIDERIDDITVGHLLDHRGGWRLSGFPDDPLFRNVEIASDLDVALPPSPDDLTNWAMAQQLDFMPGSEYHYTNIGYVVLGRVLESVADAAYENLAMRWVLEPSGITGASLAGITRDERLPGEVEYQSFPSAMWESVLDGSGDVPEPAYGGLNLEGFDASSAWVMSPIDMARLGAALDGNGDYPDIVSPTALNRLFDTPDEWSYSGGMAGSSSFLARLQDGTIVALAANTFSDDDFFEDFVFGFLYAVEGVARWPDRDLFPEFQ
jgi:N-acyl-D-amino-acid deacylase